jgi:hypothetical protein
LRPPSTRTRPRPPPERPAGPAARQSHRSWRLQWQWHGEWQWQGGSGTIACSGPARSFWYQKERGSGSIGRGWQCRNTQV